MNAQTIEHYLENPEHEENEDEGPKIEMHFPETVASGTYETLRVTKDEQELADARVYVDGIHHGETDMRGQRVIQTPEDGRFLLEVEFENETIQEVIKVAE